MLAGSLERSSIDNYYIIYCIILLKIYIHQYFLKVVVHVIIIANKIKRFYEIQVTIICSRAIPVTVTVPCKEGYLKNLACDIGKQCRLIMRLIMVCIVCLY